MSARLAEQLKVPPQMLSTIKKNDFFFGGGRGGGWGNNEGILLGHEHAVGNSHTECEHLTSVGL